MVPWEGGKGEQTLCGPFSVNIAFLQGAARESQLAADEWVQLKGKLDRFGGLYVYRDGVRVLPYGNSDFDWLEIETRRNKGQGYYFFAYRRMFGAVELTHSKNNQLVEKAGREGFQQNKAYRQLTEILIHFFIQLAADFFRGEEGNSAIYAERKRELERMEMARRKREEQVLNRRKEFKDQLEGFFAAVEAKVPEAEVDKLFLSVAEALKAAAAEKNPDSAAELLIEAEGFADRELEELKKKRTISRPRDVGLSTAVRRDWEAYVEARKRIESEVFAVAARKIRDTIGAAAKEARVQVDQRKRLLLLIGETANEVERTVKAKADDTRSAAEERFDSVKTLARKALAEVKGVIDSVRADLNRKDLNKMSPAEVDGFREELEDRIAVVSGTNREALDSARQQLLELNFEGGSASSPVITSGEITGALEEEVLALREAADADSELIQLGMALAVVNHEFDAVIRSIRGEMRRFKGWANATPQLRPIYERMSANFEHLDGYLGLFTPLQRRLYRNPQRIVDDRAYLPNDEPVPTEPATPPDTPSTISGDVGTSSSAAAPEGGTPQVNLTLGEPHGLDPEQVIDGFARHGMVCAVLKRTANDTLANQSGRLHQLVDVADVLVVDWNVRSGGADSFEATIDLLQGIVSRNRNEASKQLRLIVVYTGELDLGRVATEIRQRIEQHFGAPVQDGDFAMESAGIRIVVLGKPASSAQRTGPDRLQEVSFDQLGARSVLEFTTMTAGLVSNVAVSSLAEIRRGTHRLLTRFGKHLDAPFLTHRVLLKAPSSANEQLVPLVLAEMEALLNEELINELLSDDAIVEWLATRADPMPILQPKAGALNTEDKARAAVREICQKGLFKVQTGTSKEEWSWLNKISVSNLKTLTDAIAGEAVENANEHLEELMSLQPMYGEAAPTLSLGSILKSERPATGESPVSVDYWICVQPSCDCFIRTDGTNRRRGFPLLPLKTVEIPPFDIVVRDGVSWVRLKCEAKQFRIRMFDFEATNAEGSIESTMRDERYRFTTTEGQIFTYLGQLKFPQAQRVAQNLSSDVGRVGLTETEWLRILSGKKD